MSIYSERVKIVEVGPRDGLQSESAVWSIEDRIQLIEKLSKAGVTECEGGSFVSPQAIPAMQGTEKVWEGIRKLPLNSSFLVPNQKGLDRALEAKVKSIAVFTATSDSFTQKNIGMSVEESIDLYRKLIPAAIRSGLQVRGYLSTCFGCPYEGDQEPRKVLDLALQLLEFGCFEISVSDTIGVAHPKQIENVFGLLQSQIGIEKLAAHFHDTRGMGIVNLKTALDLGLRTFDGSIGGMGGCPYAPGASGNLATEEIVWLLVGLGYRTGIRLEMLLEVAAWVESKLGKSLKGKFYLSKAKKIYYFKDA